MKLCLSLIAFSLVNSIAYSQAFTSHDYTSVLSLEKVQVGRTILDSIQHNFNLKSDSLMFHYISKLQKLDAARTSLQLKIDTLSPSNDLRRRMTGSLDSTIRLREKTIATLNEKLRTLKENTLGKIKDLNLPPDVTEKISNLTNEIEKISIPSGDLDLAGIVPAADLPAELKDLNFTTSVPQLTDGKDLIGNVTTDLPVPAEVGTHGAEIQQLAKGDPDAINNLASTAEEKVAELSGLTDMQKEAGALNEYKSDVAKFQDPAALKEQGMEQLQQAAMDHFAGKGQIIQEAMDKMAKYKEKYESLPSLTDVPFNRPNEMRGKPWFERVVPAFMVQIQKEGNDLLVDFNPYVGYRFTGKLTAGAGWNQRIAYDTDGNRFTTKPRIYGPRVFAEYDLWKGFYPRVEVEVMNAYVSPLTKPATIDQGNREWVWGVFVGVKKEYRFIKNVKGTVLIMTRLFDPKHKSPYGDVINARFGFALSAEARHERRREFPVKKKLRQSAN